MFPEAINLPLMLEVPPNFYSRLRSLPDEFTPTFDFSSYSRLGICTNLFIVIPVWGGVLLS